MSARRIARRVALRPKRQNSCLSAVTVKSVETKDLHHSVPSLPGRGRVGRPFVARFNGQQRWQAGGFRSRISPVGVWFLLSPASARRVAWPPALRPTPFLTSSVATKQSKIKVRK
jgi:hypothetical protein